MCPDRELVSAYIDGEVPEPWNGEIARHIGTCPSCAAAERSLRAVSAAFASDAALPAPAEEAAALGRLLARVEADLRMPRRRAEPGFWRRSVAVPAPALLAAALAVAILSGGTALVARRNGELRVAAYQAAKLDALPVSAAGGNTMQSVLEYLDRQGGPVSITIQLPSSGGLQGAGGNPVILRETGYEAGK